MQSQRRSAPTSASSLVLGIAIYGWGCVGAPPEAPETSGASSSGSGESSGTTSDATESANGQSDVTGIQTSSGGQDTVGQDTVGSDTSLLGLCGDGLLDPGEACDDGNEDPSDGCLSDCTVPRSCAQILGVVPGAPDGTYGIAPDDALLQTWCDMTTDGGGWSLVAKVHPTDMDTTAPRDEPLAWMFMELATDELLTPDLTMNGPLASHGSSRFTPILGEDSLARVELVAADDFDVRVAWYKQIALPMGMGRWFDFGDEPTQVCSNLDMTDNCSMGAIHPVMGDNSPTLLSGMDLDHFGYAGGYPIHMRLDNDMGPQSFSAVCSSTEGTEWPDSYGLHWGNALLIWVRE